MSRGLKIVLASSSPRRRMLLEQVGLDFTVMEPNSSEGSWNPSPSRRVMENAYAKASGATGGCPESLVIGADTVVYLDRVMLGKPRDTGEATEMLRSLSGRVHEVYTGVSVINTRTGEDLTRCEKTLVHFRELTGEEIDAYVKSGEPMDKAGAYGVQGRGAVFVDRLIGCYYNVIGLPLSLLWVMLSELGY